MTALRRHGCGAGIRIVFTSCSRFMPSPETAVAKTVEEHRKQLRLGPRSWSKCCGPDGSGAPGLRARSTIDANIFGFADGISQPRFRDERWSVLRSGSAGRRIDSPRASYCSGTRTRPAFYSAQSDALREGQGRRARLARADHDLGKNGSYLVVRQLEQDVGGFWRAMALAGNAATIDDRVRLASKMIGRWPDGAPLVTRPEPYGKPPPNAEEFDFARDDPHGHKCPFGAQHSPRESARMALSNDPDLGLAKSKKHRILRRGRSYGEPFVQNMVPEELIRAAESNTGRPGPRGLTHSPVLQRRHREPVRIRATDLAERPRVSGPPRRSRSAPRRSVGDRRPVHHSRRSVRTRVSRRTAIRHGARWRAYSLCAKPGSGPIPVAAQGERSEESFRVDEILRRESLGEPSVDGRYQRSRLVSPVRRCGTTSCRDSWQPSIPATSPAANSPGRARERSTPRSPRGRAPVLRGGARLGADEAPQRIVSIELRFS